MPIVTHYVYDKHEIIPRVRTKYSQVVIYKEFKTFRECLEYLDSVYDGHGNIISTFNNKTISIHSPLHSDIVRVYCSDPICQYDIYGLIEMKKESENDTFYRGDILEI